MKLKIVQTSDVHGSLVGYKNVLNYVSKLEGHVIKIDSGDAIQGSSEMIFYKKNQNQFDNPIINVFNEIAYDYYIPGNHDFNYGLEYLHNFTKKIHSKTLCHNVIQGESNYFGSSYDLKIIEGVKILIIGFTNHYVPKWEKEETIPGLTFINPVENYHTFISNLKEKYTPDLIIVAYHGGFNCDENFQTLKNGSTENVGCELLNDDIDLLLTSHEHRLFVKKFNNLWISQPGYKGVNLIQFDIEFKDGKKEINGSVIDLENVAAFKEFSGLDNFKKENEKFLNQKIARNIGQSLKFKDPFKDRLNKPAIAQLFNEIQMETAGANLSICSFPNDVSGLNDDITIRDVLETYVFSNTLYLCKINGKTLKKALLENANFFKVYDHEIEINKAFENPKKMYFQYDYYEGIEYTIIVNKYVSNEIVDLKFNGFEVNDNMSFLIAMNSYRYLGGGYQTWQRDLEVIKEYPIDVAEMIIDYITREQRIKVNFKDNIKVLKGMN